ncbi:hypothetical protein IW262DRAFT_1463515 [Armillaria fumosa]|nr:hypothetical protein IW262DRAFT_1463515 [Armillaria fumosa]
MSARTEGHDEVASNKNGLRRSAEAAAGVILVTIHGTKQTDRHERNASNKNQQRRTAEAAAGAILITTNETKRTERKQREPTTSQRRNGGRSGPHHHQRNIIARNEKRDRTPSRCRSGGWTSSHRKRRETRKDSVAAPKRRLDILSGLVLGVLASFLVPAVVVRELEDGSDC